MEQEKYDEEVIYGLLNKKCDECHISNQKIFGMSFQEIIELRKMKLKSDNHVIYLLDRVIELKNENIEYERKINQFKEIGYKMQSFVF